MLPTSTTFNKPNKIKISVSIDEALLEKIRKCNEKVSPLLNRLLTIYFNPHIDYIHRGEESQVLKFKDELKILLDQYQL